MFLKNKTLISFFIFFFYFFLISFFWDFIKLPLNNYENTIGRLTLEGINPLNDSLRFLLFVGPPFLFILIFLKYNFKNKFIELTDLFIFRDFRNNNLEIKDIIIIKIIFFIYITFEFATLDFSNFIYIDSLHDGDYLTPLKNYQIYNGLWSASFAIHGGRDFLIPILSSKLFGNYNIAPVKFLYFFLLFLVKFFSIILSFQIAKISSLPKNYKKIIFTISSIFFLSLSNYESHDYLNIRDIFVLIFFIIFSQIFLKRNNIILGYLLSFCTLAALLFHYDTGIYLFLTFSFYLIYLLISKNFKDFTTTFFFFLTNFLIIYFYLGPNEINNFFDQIIHIIKNIDKIHGLEYPRPFFSIGNLPNGARATKILIFFTITSVLLGPIIFFKNKFLITQEKILILFFYLYSLISFKNALGRSDSAHIMLSSDWVTLILFYFSIFSLFYFYFIKFNKFFFQKILNILICLIIIATTIPHFYNKKIFNSFENINNYLQTPNSKFITYNEDHKERVKVVNKIKEITKGDNCVQNFTADLVMPYLLNKPTCSKFFSSWILSGNNKEIEYIDYLKQEKAEHIIYLSPIFVVDQIPTNKRLLKVDSYIKKNYTEIFNHKGYVIVKKNKN